MLNELTFQYFDIPPTICLLAGILYAIYFSKLKGPERIIALVIFLNVIADTVVYILIHLDAPSQYIYNYFLPVERVLSLVVYASVARKDSWEKGIYRAGMVVIFGVYLVGIIQKGFAGSFHIHSNTITALIFTVLSYVFLRSVSIGKIKATVLIIAFAVANLLYSWVTVSALSSIPLALKIDSDVAENLFDINLIGYTFYCCILILALGWKLKRNLLAT